MDVQGKRPIGMKGLTIQQQRLTETVLLQAMKDEPAEDAKCKDKFLVQTVSVTRDMEFANVTSIVSPTIFAPISFHNH